MALLGGVLRPGRPMPAPDGGEIYRDLCASCHAETRLGGTRALPDARKSGAVEGRKLEAVIGQGRPMTQMPGFGATLSAADIAAVAAYVSRLWRNRRSGARPRLPHTPDDGRLAPPPPRFDADPMNITLVVETGDQPHVSVLDGDTFAVLDRFQTPLPCMAGRSSARMGALSSSCRAMAGCRNTISGRWPRSAACVPG
jgi:cytochrome c553